MATAFDQELISYFSKPENLAHTFEIARYAEKVKVQILSRFWESLSIALLAKAPIGRKSTGWAIVPFERMDLQYAAIRVMPKEVARQRENLAYTIEHQTNSS